MKILPHSTTLLFLALFGGNVYAQVPIALTSIPQIAVVGETYQISWGGGTTDSNVTITLLQGGPNSLAMVGVLYTGPPSPPSFQWTVSSGYEAADDYALEVEQDGGINYSGLFTIRARDTISAVPTGTSASTSNTRATASSASNSVNTPSESASSVEPSASQSPTSAASTPAVSSDPSASGLGAGAIAGIVIGSIGALALIVIAVLLYMRWRPVKPNTTIPDSSDHHGELGAGHKANRHELYGKQKRSGEVVEKDGREVRIKSGGVQELAEQEYSGREPHVARME